MRPSPTPNGALAPPRLIPGRGQLPVLLSVPHAGRAYPDWLVRLSRRGAASLAPLEDPLVDRLVGLSRLRVLRPVTRQVVTLIHTLRH